MIATNVPPRPLQRPQSLKRDLLQKTTACFESTQQHPSKPAQMILSSFDSQPLQQQPQQAFKAIAVASTTTTTTTGYEHHEKRKKHHIRVDEVHVNDLYDFTVDVLILFYRAFSYRHPSSSSLSSLQRLLQKTFLGRKSFQTPGFACPSPQSCNGKESSSEAAASADAKFSHMSKSSVPTTSSSPNGSPISGPQNAELVMELHAFVRWVHKRTTATPLCVITALLYLESLMTKTVGKVDQRKILGSTSFNLDLFKKWVLVAVVLSCKFNADVFRKNVSWVNRLYNSEDDTPDELKASVQISLVEFNTLERRFLRAIDWQLWVELTEVREFVGDYIGALSV